MYVSWHFFVNLEHWKSFILNIFEAFGIVESKGHYIMSDDRETAIITVMSLMTMEI